MHFATGVFWCLLAQNQPLTLVDLLPLVEKTENLVFFAVYCVFSQDLWDENGAIISFINAARKWREHSNGANIQMVSRFCLAAYNGDCLILTFHRFISAC